jgi:hypothetical protein
VVRGFISAALVLALLAGGVPCLSCTPAVCAVDTQCAAVRCGCCGPNCPWLKGASGSHRQGVNGAQRCPVVVAGRPAVIPAAGHLAVALLHVYGAPSISVACATDGVFWGDQTSCLQSQSSLLSLGCALTV